MDLLTEIDALIDERHLLKHPLYRAWEAGELSRDALRGYACQYYHWVRAFPTYISAVHSNGPDLAARQALLENLVDEELGDDNHPELWLRFCDALGLGREQVLATPPLPETEALLATYDRLTRWSPFAVGVAALYAYESQQPAIVERKSEGLRKFYAVHGGHDFFDVHRTADVEHSASERALVRDYGQPYREAVANGVSDALLALSGLLDGVTRAYIDSAA
jgi:pyrroloquinoline-quinone synthase